jgi:hypothetical protein
MTVFISIGSLVIGTLAGCYVAMTWIEKEDDKWASK